MAPEANLGEPRVGPRDEPTDTHASVTMSEVGKTFDGDVAVEGLTFDVPDGSVFGLIGPSGCGKTTTVRMMNGALQPTSGEVQVFGRAPHRLGASDRQRVGYLPQQPVLFDGLSAWENLQFHAGINGVRFRRAKRLRSLLDFVELAGDESRAVREMSGGMQRRLALAAALVHDPDLIFLDEPTAGIDPILRTRLWGRFHELADEGKTLVVTTQYIGEAAHCDRVGLMAEGTMVELDAPEALRDSAAGGELLLLETDRPLTRDELADIGRQPGVVGEVERIGDGSQIRFAFKRGDEQVESVVRAALAETGVDVLLSRPTVLEYDEMFVRLVERHGAGSAEDPDSTPPETSLGAAVAHD